VRPLCREWPVEVDVKVAPGFDRGRVVRDGDTHRQVHERRCEHDRGECTERPVIDLPIRPGRPPKGQMYGQNRQGPQNVDPVASVPSQEMGKGGEQAGIPAALIASLGFVSILCCQRLINDNYFYRPTTTKIPGLPVSLPRPLCRPVASARRWLWFHGDQSCSGSGPRLNWRVV
jgi:hypothetical protein